MTTRQRRPEQAIRPISEVLRNLDLERSRTPDNNVRSAVRVSEAETRKEFNILPLKKPKSRGSGSSSFSDRLRAA